MDLEFDLLERRSDGVLTWRGTVRGLAAAHAQARQLAVETGNECFVSVASDEVELSAASLSATVYTSPARTRARRSGT